MSGVRRWEVLKCVRKFKNFKCSDFSHYLACCIHYFFKFETTLKPFEVYDNDNKQLPVQEVAKGINTFLPGNSLKFTYVCPIFVNMIPDKVDHIYEQSCVLIR